MDITAEDAIERTEEDEMMSGPAVEEVRSSDEIAELRGKLEGNEINVTIVGCGEAGCNTVNRLSKEGVTGVRLVAANTDAQNLNEIDADEKILIDRKFTQNPDAGSESQVGEETITEVQNKIYDAVNTADMVLVIAGLGGDTSTGLAPIIAKVAREAGVLTVPIVTLPFTTEGEVRRTNAEAGLERLRDVSDTVIVVPNDRLLDSVGKLPVRQAFQVSDEVLMRSVKGITELITKPGLVNLDFADVKTVMEKGGVAMIGLGEADSEQKAQDSVKSALRSPLLDVDISGANSALVNVTGDSDMSIEEAEGIVEEIYDRIDPDARIIWGTSIDDSLEGQVRTMIVVVGVEMQRIYGQDDPTSNEENTNSGEIRDRLEPTPLTLKQLPKKDPEAHFYYFTDSTYANEESRFKKLDNQLTLLARNRVGLDVTIIDRDRGISSDEWDLLKNGIKIENYPALVVASQELGVEYVDAFSDNFSPSNTEYAVLENGIIADQVLKNVDEINDFLNALYDCARHNEVESGMKKEKILRGLKVGKDSISDLIQLP